MEAQSANPPFGGFANPADLAGTRFFLSPGPIWEPQGVGIDPWLGARALYLYKGNRDTYYRIHGTNQPRSIGTASSNGCIRMINDHVIDLYNRTPVGTRVVVL